MGRLRAPQAQIHEISAAREKSGYNCTVTAVPHLKHDKAWWNPEITFTDIPRYDIVRTILLFMARS